MCTRVYFINFNDLHDHPLFYIITEPWIFIQIYSFMTVAEEIEFKWRF